jgi:glycosyltransferase involved in cell wall biosynthesis
MESVLSQTWDNFEYIVVDGLSSDQTLSIVQEYEPRFKGRLHYISQRDEGIYDAINKGLKMATGDIIGILNSDDFYTSNDVLEVIARYFESDQYDAIYADVHYVCNDNLQKCKRYYSSRLFHSSFMRIGLMPAHPSFYCRKYIYDKYGIYDTHYRVAADFDILLRFIYFHHIKTKYVPKDFVTMRLGGVSTNGYASLSLIMSEHLRILKHHKLYTNRFLLSLRYIYKLFEFL